MMTLHKFPVRFLVKPCKFTDLLSVGRLAVKALSDLLDIKAIVAIEVSLFRDFGKCICAKRKGCKLLEGHSGFFLVQTG